MTIGPAGGEGRVLDSRPDGGGQGLHLAFSARRSETGDAEIRCTAWGLSDASLSALQGADAGTVLEAGHGGSLTTLGRGLVVPGSVRPERMGRAWMASWEVSDGVLDLRRVRVSLSWAQVDAQRALAEVRRAVPDIGTGVIRLGRAHTWARGLVLTSSVYAALDRIAEDTGSRWEVVGGALHMWPRGEAMERRRVTIASDTGLQSCQRGADGTWEAVTLLEPSVRPGDEVSVESALYRGSLRVSAVEHAGDSGYDAAYHTTIVGVP